MRAIISTLLLLTLLGGCSTVSAGVQLASGAASATGMVGKSTAKVIGKSAKVVKKTVTGKKKK
jgi:uncharacterized protein YceK